MFQYKYIPAKPVTFDSLPGYRWHYIEAPPAKAHMMGGVPKSQYEHGVIAVDRMVLERTRHSAGLTELNYPGLNLATPKTPPQYEDEPEPSTQKPRLVEQ